MKAVVRINFFRNDILAAEIKKEIELPSVKQIGIRAKQIAEQTKNKYGYDRYEVKPIHSRRQATCKNNNAVYIIITMVECDFKVLKER